MRDRRQTASPVINASLSLIEIDRAITDLRRGGSVIIAKPPALFLVQAAEAITAESLARFNALAGPSAPNPGRSDSGIGSARPILTSGTARGLGTAGRRSVPSIC